MTELPRAQLLSEATAVLQAMALNGIRIDDRRFERYVTLVLAEYDSRGTQVTKLTAALTDVYSLLTDEETVRDSDARRRIRAVLPVESEPHTGSQTPAP